MLHKNPSQIGLRGILRILYPKKYPIFIPKQSSTRVYICVQIVIISN